MALCVSFSVAAIWLLSLRNGTSRAGQEHPILLAWQTGEVSDELPPTGENLEPGPYYHGSKTDLKRGDLLQPGYRSNFGERRVANYVYLTATLDAATWGAELAVGEGRGRIYQVEPTGPIEDDPNLTDKKFPGNPKVVPITTPSPGGWGDLRLGAASP